MRGKVKNSLKIFVSWKLFTLVGVALAYLGSATQAFAVPPQPVAVAPVGNINTANPDFVWKDQSDAIQYRVLIFDNQAKERVHLKTYNKSDVCSDNVCRLQLDLQLGFSQNHRFHLKARSTEGYSNWTRSRFHFVETPPARVTGLVPPDSAIGTATTFQWLEAPDVTTYQLFVRSRATKESTAIDFSPVDVCDGVTCTVDAASLDLPLGNRLFFKVRAYNSGGWSSWSARRDFIYAIPPQVTDLIPPDRDIQTAPVFQWSSVPDAIAYKLYVRNRESKERVVWQDYEADDICDGVSCTVGAADLGLPVDKRLLFKVRGYNTAGWNNWSSANYFTYVSASNESPLAVLDVASVVQGDSVVVDVIGNDVDIDGTIDPGTVVVVRQPTNGVAEPQSDGTILYKHNSGSTTTDRFSYKVSDDLGGDSNIAAVDIEILIVNEVIAFHRSGQTFLTWSESSPSNYYHVYRSSSPITEANLGLARRLTNRWGPLDNNTSVNSYGGHPELPVNYVIEDLAPALADDKALFVYTTKLGDSSRAYYAVTSVVDGIEDTTTLQVAGKVTESVAIPRDVLTVSVNDGKGRIYTQYMDYSNWNPTFNGYAYNYSVALPYNYNPAKAYPLLIEPHAFDEEPKFRTESEYSWEVIQLFPYDPGSDVGSVHSWWYGYAADHNYLTDGDVPSSGRIANFTEQRVMRSVDTIIANSDFNVDERRIHGYGNSMGASGVLSWGMRYPSLLAGVYASQPMTNYGVSPTFDTEFVQLWGSIGDNLPIVNGGPHDEDIRFYGEDGVQSVGVYDWMNHQKQLVDRRGDEFAYLMTSHGKSDWTIDWLTQGKPMVQALTDASVGFSAVANGNSHVWAGFDAVVQNMFGFGYDAEFPWKYPLDLSFPAIQNASGSGDIVPGDTPGVVDSHNLDIEWATAHNPFDTGIVDLPNRYEITIKSTADAQTADITPRRTQQFNRRANDQCSWTATDRATGESVGSGNVVADVDSLVTVKNLAILGGAGTRLAIDCSVLN